MLVYSVSLADLLSRRQKEMISKGTGCDYQTRSIKCPERDFYRTITGECNNRWDLCVDKVSLFWPRVDDLWKCLSKGQEEWNAQFNEPITEESFLPVPVRKKM